MPKYVIGTAPLAPEVEASLVQFFEARGLNWWHWLPNLWLVISMKEMGIQTFRTELRQAIGQSKEMLVLQVEGTDWAGAAFDRNGAKMGDWLDASWASVKAPS